MSLPGAWVQTFPTFGPPATIPPAGETLTNACPGPNTVGYEFTAVSGQTSAATTSATGSHRCVPRTRRVLRS